MANTITALVPDLYEALDVVSRELVGFIPAVTMDPSFDRAAVGQIVRSFVAPAVTATDITPGVTPPNDGDQTFGNVSMTITKSRRVPFRWNGEETRGVNSGPQFGKIKINQLAQAFRTLCNEVESDIAATHIATSRAFGTPGTTPFATNLGDPAQMRKILSDNGAPLTDMQLVIDTTAGAAMRTLAQLGKVNEAGNDQLLRQGVLLDIHNFAVRESGKVLQGVAAGTGTAYTTNTAGYAVGATVITLITGSGTVLAGDTVTFAGDTNKYVVAVGTAAPGAITLAAPGLVKAIAASATAMTIGAAATRNMAFARTAIVLATRAPALPDGGDLAIDRTIITDPRSGLSFEVAMYPQYRQMQYEVSLAWGVKNVKPEHSGILLG